MAEPTLKDVLDAMKALDGKVEAHRTATRTELADVRREMAAKSDLAEVRREVAEARREVAEVRREVGAHRAETAKGFAELDRELTDHTKVHREIEEDIEALKRRPARTAARSPRRR
jgi:chromosome segregation ATPase